MKDLKISHYDYHLPEERIAKFPVPQRDLSKLLVYRESGGRISEHLFRDLPEALPRGALLVFNNTRVVRARIIMHKSSGARIEIFCLEPHAPADHERAFSVRESGEWLCMIGGLKKWKEGTLQARFNYSGQEYTLSAVKGPRQNNAHIVRFEWDAPLTFGGLLEHLGRIPIPPYLNRESEEIDNTRYQTVYSKMEGSVAAPTAGLHFTPELISRMKSSGFGFEEITLHVGAGTFLPVKEEDVDNHQMHTEHFEVSISAVESLAAAYGNIIPVGTTSVRTLESLTVLGYRIMQKGTPETFVPIGQLEAYDIPAQTDGKQLLEALAGWMRENGSDRIKAATRIMIKPGYVYRVTSGMITNFHQPKSTLLLLVSAFIGEAWERVYDYALAHDFRFLSYGDSSLLLK